MQAALAKMCNSGLARQQLTRNTFPAYQGCQLHVLVVAGPVAYPHLTHTQHQL
jgi:hypothetical protein